MNFIMTKIFPVTTCMYYINEWRYFWKFFWRNLVIKLFDCFIRFNASPFMMRCRYPKSSFFFLYFNIFIFDCIAPEQNIIWKFAQNENSILDNYRDVIMMRALMSVFIERLLFLSINNRSIISTILLLIFL